MTQKLGFGPEDVPQPGEILKIRLQPDDICSHFGSSLSPVRGPRCLAAKSFTCPRSEDARDARHRCQGAVETPPAHADGWQPKAAGLPAAGN